MWCNRLQFIWVLCSCHHTFLSVSNAERGAKLFCTTITCFAHLYAIFTRGDRQLYILTSRNWSIAFCFLFFESSSSSESLSWCFFILPVHTVGKPTMFPANGGTDENREATNSPGIEGPGIDIRDVGEADASTISGEDIWSGWNSTLTHLVVSGEA